MSSAGAISVIKLLRKSVCKPGYTPTHPLLALQVAEIKKTLSDQVASRGEESHAGSLRDVLSVGEIQLLNGRTQLLKVK